jgi:hypothetical protein
MSVKWNGGDIYILLLFMRRDARGGGNWGGGGVELSCPNAVKIATYPADFIR